MFRPKPKPLRNLVPVSGGVYLAISDTGTDQAPIASVRRYYTGKREGAIDFNITPDKRIDLSLNRLCRLRDSTAQINKAIRESCSTRVHLGGDIHITYDAASSLVYLRTHEYSAKKRKLFAHRGGVCLTERQYTALSEIHWPQYIPELNTFTPCYDFHGDTADSDESAMACYECFTPHTRQVQQ